jgi:hypothetical protein
MKVIFVDPRKDSRWLTLIKRFNASVFHSPLWMKVLAQTYGFDIGAYIALDDSSEPVAGMAFCHVQDFLGERLVALSFSDHFDPLVKDYDVWNVLVSEINKKGLPYTLRCLHNSIPLNDGRFVPVKNAKWHGLNVDADIDELWKGLHDSIRRNIKKARRNGVSIEITSDRCALEKFFQMHLRVRKYKYMLLPQPYRFFENIRDIFNEAGKFYLLVARYQKEIIAGTIFLGSDSTLYYKFNASDSKFLCHRPNDLIVWEAIQWAISQGYQYLDFGLSDVDQPGLIRFKRQFGSVEKEIVHLAYHQEAINSDPAMPQKKQLLGSLTKLLTENSVPDDITAQGGEILYKFFT